MIALTTVAICHLATAAALWFSGASQSRRLLALAFLAAIPVLGIPLAVLAIVSPGGGRPADHSWGETLGSRLVPPEVVAQMAARPALLDRLTGPERRNALAAIGRRPDRRTVDALKWVIEHGEADATVDVALTLEQMRTRLEDELEAARDDHETNKCAQSAQQIAELASTSIVTGLADDALLTELAIEARSHFEVALAGGVAHTDLVSNRVALELATGGVATATELIAELESGPLRRTLEVEIGLLSLGDFVAPVDANLTPKLS